ncbi:MAG: hypothetical protein A2V69_02205 [Candidatus Portnoybacteria bacterium RBG_13_40_8]|uniref:Methylated-DNA-[protein]-cysteine S-methyltransferase DNA binding domain-containing protein n=1 Tax=Candidatus Portnoybacteria bacterium RBG_13_40_8 TaxID=1801990 RepID=A0A1G2F3H7_9BACT|nr:MAG: hypothetical protein A2V69_02205 [Candidatus Portnoybacteria bacterium RBG_13_40_8]OGZ35043.1 MAG: hypothetical protein A2V60_01370 [Candidatus Portnoybacteria bacterium RIFCSPHIGHO2_01_FULL_39_19]
MSHCRGKSFTQKVLAVVAKIPKGETKSYKEVAIAAGNPRAYRAVGNIMNRHKIKGLPCHRVIRSDGSFGGYRWGAKKKAEILKREIKVATIIKSKNNKMGIGWANKKRRDRKAKKRSKNTIRDKSKRR